jgi:predicted ATPase with chaperone activity
VTNGESRVTRTIADLDGAERVNDQAVAKALMYRAYEMRRSARI